MSRHTQFGIYHATVNDLVDPEDRGRMKVELLAFDPTADGDISPWCHPCVPFAGDGYGLFMLPQVGDEVIVAPLASGDWVVLGAHWSGRKAKPAAASLTNRVLRTPAGHQLELNDEGDVTVQARDNGATIIIKANGEIHLNSDDYPVLTEHTPCQYTGKSHSFGSSTVKARD